MASDPKGLIRDQAAAQQRFLSLFLRSEREVFRYVAAQEVVHRRDVLLRTLRQQGVLTLEVDPAKLSSAVVNRYLGAKERSLI